MSIRILALFAIALIVSCSSDSAKTGIAQSEWEKVIAIRGEARDLLRELNADAYNRRVSGSASERAAILGHYAALASIDNIDLLQRVEDSFPPGSDERKFRRLRLFLIEVRVEHGLLTEQEYLDEMIAQQRVEINDRSLSLGEAAALLSSSPDRFQRERVYAGLLPLLQRENAVRSRILELSDSALFHFGYGSILSYVESKLEVDYAALAEQARAFLAASDSLYFALAEEFIPQLSGVQLANFRGHDLAYLLAADPFARLFDRDSLSSRAMSTLATLAVSPESLATIRIVHESNGRPGRSTTYPVAIPDDIRIVISAASGSQLYHQYYHELGHAAAYLYSGERELEFSLLGGVTVTEAAAFAIEDLLLEAGYLSEVLGLSLEDARDVARVAAFQRLLLMRQLAGELLYEQVLYSEVDSLPDDFEAICQPVFGYPWNEVDRAMYLRTSRDETAAGYLQGLWLAAQLRKFAVEQIGPDYYRHADFGFLLRRFWSYGRRLSAEQMAAEFELGKLDFTVALNHLDSLCRR